MDFILHSQQLASPFLPPRDRPAARQGIEFSLRARHTRQETTHSHRAAPGYSDKDERREARGRTPSSIFSIPTHAMEVYFFLLRLLHEDKSGYRAVTDSTCLHFCSIARKKAPAILGLCGNQMLSQASWNTQSATITTPASRHPCRSRRRHAPSESQAPPTPS